MLRPLCLCFAFTFVLSGISNAAIFGCTETAVPPVVKGEGIAERTGDILLNCAGG